MNRGILSVVVILILWMSIGCEVEYIFMDLIPLTPRKKPQDHGMVAHNVYFTLKDASDGEKEKLRDACYKYLKDHAGVVYFIAGTLAEELHRPVNDRDFDVSLHVVFASRADHDAYQEAPRHLEFIELHKDNWKTVRVFDTQVK